MLVTFVDSPIADKLGRLIYCNCYHNCSYNQIILYDDRQDIVVQEVYLETACPTERELVQQALTNLKTLIPIIK